MIATKPAKPESISSQPIGMAEMSMRHSEMKAKAICKPTRRTK